MAKLLKIQLGLVLFPLAIIWRGFVLSILWNWFVSPLGFAPINWVWAIGLATIITLFAGKGNAKEKTSEEWFVLFALSFLLPAMALGIGALARWAM